MSIDFYLENSIENLKYFNYQENSIEHSIEKGMEKMSKKNLIDLGKPQNPKQQSSTRYFWFNIPVNKIDDNSIDPEKKYKIYAEEVA